MKRVENENEEYERIEGGRGRKDEERSEKREKGETKREQRRRSERLRFQQSAVQDTSAKLLSWWCGWKREKGGRETRLRHPGPLFEVRVQVLVAVLLPSEGRGEYEREGRKASVGRGRRGVR